MPRCCVPDCAQLGPAERVCRLPIKYPKLLKKWLENINSPLFKGKTIKQLSYLRVCARHFEDHFLVSNWQHTVCNRFVQPGAYPTLNLKPLSIQEILELRGKFSKKSSKRNNLIVSDINNVNTSDKYDKICSPNQNDKLLQIEKSNNDKSVIIDETEVDVLSKSSSNKGGAIDLNKFKVIVKSEVLESENLSDDEIDTRIGDVLTIASDDETVILDSFNHETIHNYSGKNKPIKKTEEKQKPKSDFFKYHGDKIDPNKTVLIDYVDGKIVWNYIHKSKVETLDSTDNTTEPDAIRCCICFEINIDLISFFQMDDNETYFNKMKATFPDMQLDFNDLSSMVCATCSENLRIAHKFRNTVLEGQKKMKEVQPKIWKDSKILRKALLKPQLGVQKPSHLKNTLMYEIDNISSLNKGSPKKQKLPLNLKRCDKNKVVQDILSKLDGIIITKTKNNPDIEKINTNIYRCNFCSLQFNNLMPLYHHKIFNHGQDQYRHRILNKMKSQKQTQFITENGENIENVPPKKKRKKEKIIKPVLFCEKCPQTFRSEIVFNQHKNRHEGIKNFYCEKCGKGFYFMNQLKNHLEIHNETRDYKCKTCDKMFKGKIHLEAHKRLHPSENFICHVCGKTLKHSMGLKMHMLCHTNERKFKCSFCDLSFKRKSELHVHTRLHTNEKPFKCTKCDECFRTSNSLKIHLIRIHLKVRNFKCNYCDKKFFTSKNLQQHTLTHTSYRIPCKLCNKTFKLLKSLQRHVKLVHLNIRNFECEICKKRFRENHCLKVHMRVHSAEKFECTKCLKLFKLAANLKIHMEKRHSEMQVYICSYCKCNFETIEDIQKHDCIILLPDNSSQSSD